MNQSNKSILASCVASALLLTGCGGSGESEPEREQILRGVFVDSPIQGLRYDTQSQSGITDNLGGFSYLEGESVVFSIGGLELPEVVAQETLTPLEIADSDRVDSMATVNILRLLQSMDDDSNPGNGITIPPEAHENVTAPEFNFSAILDFEAVIRTALTQTYGTEREIVESQAAVDHLIDTLSELSADSETSSWDLDFVYLVEAGEAFNGAYLSIRDVNYEFNLDNVWNTGVVEEKHGVYRVAVQDEKKFLSLGVGDDGDQLACLASRPYAAGECAGDGRLFNVFSDESTARQFAENQLAGNTIAGETDTRPEPDFEAARNEIDATDGGDNVTSGGTDGGAGGTTTGGTDGTGTGTGTGIGTGDVTPGGTTTGNTTNGGAATGGATNGSVTTGGTTTGGTTNGGATTGGIATGDTTTGGNPAPAGTGSEGSDSGLLRPEDLFPLCSDNTTDTDGDRYGWENGDSCYFSDATETGSATTGGTADTTQGGVGGTTAGDSTGTTTGGTGSTTTGGTTGATAVGSDGSATGGATGTNTTGTGGTTTGGTTDGTGGTTTGGSMGTTTSGTGGTTTGGTTGTTTGGTGGATTGGTTGTTTGGTGGTTIGGTTGTTTSGTGGTTTGGTTGTTTGGTGGTTTGGTTGTTTGGTGGTSTGGTTGTTTSGTGGTTTGGTTGTTTGGTGGTSTGGTTGTTTSGTGGTTTGGTTGTTTSGTGGTTTGGTTGTTTGGTGGTTTGGTTGGTTGSTTGGTGGDLSLVTTTDCPADGALKAPVTFSVWAAQPAGCPWNQFTGPVWSWGSSNYDLASNSVTDNVGSTHLGTFEHSCTDTATGRQITVTATCTVTVDAAPGVEDITDLFFLTGQANASGSETAFDPNLDGLSPQVFAFTDAGWQLAELYQFWEQDLPGNHAHQFFDRSPYNNIAFQVAKSLAAKSDRVIGIVMLTAPGEGISHWDYNSEFFIEMRNKATAALNALPQKSAFDSILWLQGETDWLLEGTADPGATGFSDTNSDFYRNYYPNKLNQLIGNFRSEGWFGSNGKFLCAETKKAAVNTHLMALNSDNDSHTGCAAASDLATRDTDPYGNHFSADALRILGGRIADVYLGMTP